MFMRNGKRVELVNQCHYVHRGRGMSGKGSNCWSGQEKERRWPGKRRKRRNERSSRKPSPEPARRYRTSHGTTFRTCKGRRERLYMRCYPAFDGCKKGIDHLFVERGKRVQKRLRNQFKKWLDILGLNTQKSSHKVLAHSHLGWILSEMGKRVLMIDADSQCNLTGLCLSLAGTEDIEEFYNYSGIH